MMLIVEIQFVSDFVNFVAELEEDLNSDCKNSEESCDVQTSIR